MSPLVHSPASSAQYSDIYSQFVQRYRSRPSTFYEIADEQDNYRNQTQFLDDESDEERPATSRSIENGELYSSPLLESEVLEPVTVEERERLEWQSMLASVLDGDVLKSEKSRIQTALMTSSEGGNNKHLDLWMGLRARLRDRRVEEERKILEERRLHLVDRVILEIKNFRVVQAAEFPSALDQVNVVLRHLDKIQSFYPHLRAFHLDKPSATEPEFQAICDTLYTWSTVLASLRQQISLLRRWTGSDTLDVTQRSTSAEHGKHFEVTLSSIVPNPRTRRWYFVRRARSQGRDYTAHFREGLPHHGPRAHSYCARHAGQPRVNVRKTQLTDLRAGARAADLLPYAPRSRMPEGTPRLREQSVRSGRFHN